MIDPKFNDLPATGSTEGIRPKPGSDAPAQRAPQGLSINDTIAGDTLLSTGSTGVDTSGVRAGAGAGAGSSSLNTSPSGSPSPNIVPGARGTATTLDGANTSGQGPMGRTETGIPGTGRTELDLAGDPDADPAEYAASQEEISARALECWYERGCPDGSPEVDWHRAEQEVRTRRGRSLTASV